MSERKWPKKLDEFMKEFLLEIRMQPPGTKEAEFQCLENVFNQAVLDIKNHVSSVEYGQHVEALYDINTNDTFGRDRSFIHRQG